uniref:Ion transport domain-containing protein n=1 Tax=Panagrolaimus davidi TaxID=227884 RepID=A0A914QXL9_9BILA
MIGEFDYKDSVSSKDSLITSAMFCLFLFAVTIFLMNLLTGLAVSDTTKILEEAVLRRRIMQIENIHHIELILPKWIKTRYWDGYCKVPKEATQIEKETHRITTPKFRKLFKWWGISNKKEAAKRIDDGNVVEEKLDTLKQEIGQRIDGLEDKVNEKMNDIIEMLKQR